MEIIERYLISSPAYLLQEFSARVWLRFDRDANFTEVKSYVLDLIFKIYVVIRIDQFQCEGFSVAFSYTIIIGIFPSASQQVVLCRKRIIDDPFNIPKESI